MNLGESLRQIYTQVVREFKFEADKIVRRAASRKRVLQLSGSLQAETGWSDDDVFDTIINWRKQKKLPSLHELLNGEN